MYLHGWASQGGTVKLRSSRVALLLLLSAVGASCAATGPTKPVSADRTAIEFATRVYNEHAFALERGRGDVVEQPNRVEFFSAFGIGGATMGKARKSDHERVSMVKESFDAYCQTAGGQIVGKVCRSHDGFKALFLVEVDQIQPPPGKEKLGLTWVALRVVEPRPGVVSGREYVEQMLENEARATADAERKRRQALEQRLAEGAKGYATIGIGSRVCSEGTDERRMATKLVGFLEGKNDGRFQIRLAGTSQTAVREFLLQNEAGMSLVRVNDIIWDDARRWHRC